MFGSGNKEEKQDTITISRKQFKEISKEMLKQSISGENRPENMKQDPMIMMVEGIITAKLCHDLEVKLFGKSNEKGEM